MVSLLVRVEKAAFSALAVIDAAFAIASVQSIVGHDIVKSLKMMYHYNGFLEKKKKTEFRCLMCNIFKSLFTFLVQIDCNVTCSFYSFTNSREPQFYNRLKYIKEEKRERRVKETKNKNVYSLKFCIGA